MARQLTPYEALSYELNLLRERRVAERRMIQRDTAERRQAEVGDRAEPEPDAHALDSSNQTP
jgi:hypothetical protein